MSSARARFVIGDRVSDNYYPNLEGTIISICQSSVGIKWDNSHPKSTSHYGYDCEGIKSIFKIIPKEDLFDSLYERML